MIKRGWGLLSGLLVLLFGLFLFSNPVHAQFPIDLGSISGSVQWGTQVFPAEKQVIINGNTTGFGQNFFANPNYTTGFILPPDTYTVTSFIRLQKGNGRFFDINIGSGQTVTVAGGVATFVPAVMSSKVDIYNHGVAKVFGVLGKDKKPKAVIVYLEGQRPRKGVKKSVRATSPLGSGLQPVGVTI